MTNTQNTNDFDSIIIGGGLSGLLTASILAKAGQKKIAIVESEEELGGSSRPFTTPFGVFDGELKFVPHSSTSDASIAFLEAHLSDSIGAQVVESSPLTYDAGKLKSFVGFGSTTPMTANEINYYSGASNYRFEKTPKDWVSSLAAQAHAKIFNRSEVTSLIFENQKVTGAVINANKTLTADHFIWAAPPHALIAMMKDEQLPNRQKQKLAKSPFFAAVHLDLIFSKNICETDQIHILQGANEEPLAGQFMTLGENQSSQWISFIDVQEADNEEFVASILKYMKRQIGRAYEGALDAKVYERITLNNFTHGKALLDLDHSRLGKLQNFWICNSAFSASGNLLGSLEQCQEFAQNFAQNQSQLRPVTHSEAISDLSL
jgi:hypothetical protein